MQRVDGRGNGPAPDMCIRVGHPITTFALKENYWGGESITKFLLKDMYAAAGHPIKMLIEGQLCWGGASNRKSSIE